MYHQIMVAPTWTDVQVPYVGVMGAPKEERYNRGAKMTPQSVYDFPGTIWPGIDGVSPSDYPYPR